MLTPADFDGLNQAGCVCLGSGRFLRSVLVPMMAKIGLKTVLCQPRGTNVVDMLKSRTDGSFEIEIVGERIQAERELHRGICGAFSLGREHASVLADIPMQGKNLQVIGVGITEAGHCQGSPAIEALAQLLHSCSLHLPKTQISIICTDNIAQVGDRLKDLVKKALFVNELAEQQRLRFAAWLASNANFHNTMVDRIVGNVDNQPEIPRTEPLPKKALVLEDLAHGGSLPDGLENVAGVLVRRLPGQLEVDIALKLRIANAIHTAIVHAMALSGKNVVSEIDGDTVLAKYMQKLYDEDIRPGLVAAAPTWGWQEEKMVCEANQVFEEWVRRLNVPLGQLTWFVTQNWMEKVEQRLLPTLESNAWGASDSMAFAIAAILRFVTPTEEQASDQGPVSAKEDVVFLGQGTSKDFINVTSSNSGDSGQISFGPGLFFRSDGAYSFVAHGPEQAAIPRCLMGAFDLDAKEASSAGRLAAMMLLRLSEPSSTASGLPPPRVPEKASQFVGRVGELYAAMLQQSPLDAMAKLTLG